MRRGVGRRQRATCSSCEVRRNPSDAVPAIEARRAKEARCKGERAESGDGTGEGAGTGQAVRFRAMPD